MLLSEQSMSRYWSAVVRGLTPYVPGEEPRLPNLVKLNSNEKAIVDLVTGKGSITRK